MTYKEWQEKRIALLIERFRGYRAGMVVSLDTTVYHSKPFDKDLEPFLQIDSYDNTPVIWANPVTIDDKSIQVQQLYIPYQSDGLEALKVARRTLSLMCFMAHGISIIDKYNMGDSYPGIPVAQDKFRYSGINGYDFDLLFRAVDVSQINEQCWIALAYYRLGANSTSEYYRFLSLRQVVEVSFSNEAKAVEKWFNEQARSDDQIADWLSKLPKGTKASGRLHATRAICAHVANKDDGNPTIITDPDDVASVTQVQEDLGVMKIMAEKRLRNFSAISRL